MSQGQPTSVLYGVLVGINTYGNPKMQLNSARSDAERLGAALRANAGRYAGVMEPLSRQRPFLTEKQTSGS